jgi:hypothetical protein
MTNQPKQFQKRVEDFDCEKCGTHNIGTGFTNHCKECLWSKHVDVHPGDRIESCGGMMEPCSVDYEKGEYTLNHVCKKCGFTRRKKVETNDNFDAVVAIVKKNIKK